MHFIQRKILGKLLYADWLTYSAMRPEATESNLYAYHLEQLVKEGLVAKTDAGYTLSPAGLRLIDRLSQNKMADRLQPHIVTAIDVTDGAGRTLLFKHNFQPYIYQLGFPLGKIHYEENLQQAAERELSEKSGLEGVPLSHRGLVYITAIQDGVVISKIACHIFQGFVENALDVRPRDSQRGECLWLDHTLLRPGDVMPGFLATKRLLQTAQGLVFDEFVEEL